MGTMIAVEHVGFAYPGVEDAPGVPVFEDLNLQIEQGSFTAILGTNGCGKSTLAKLFNAILVPTKGKVTVCGIDTSDPDRLMAVRRNVGMVFQNPDNQIVANVVEEDVAFGPENLGIASPEIRRRVDQALVQVGMYDYREHSPSLLSGGQKQRVAIAGILAMEPRCIVLDEPTAMLDPRGRRDVMDTVKRLNKEKGITVILITHHMEEAAGADRVVILSRGKVAADGSPKEVFCQVDLLHSLGLAAPEPVELCWELNRKGYSLPLDALSPEQCAQLLYNWIES